MTRFTFGEVNSHKSQKNHCAAIAGPENRLFSAVSRYCIQNYLYHEASLFGDISTYYRLFLIIMLIRNKGTNLFFGHCYPRLARILSKKNLTLFPVLFQTPILAQRPPRQKPRKTIACADRYTPCNTQMPTSPRPRTGPAR